jgi:hypothetical protein
LEEYERHALEDILANDERIAAGYRLLQRFRRLVARQCVRRVADVVSTLAPEQNSFRLVVLACGTGQRLVDTTPPHRVTPPANATLSHIWPSLRSALTLAPLTVDST